VRDRPPCEATIRELFLRGTLGVSEVVRPAFVRSPPVEGDALEAFTGADVVREVTENTIAFHACDEADAPALIGDYVDVHYASMGLIV
jgi:hypothetical protein